MTDPRSTVPRRLARPAIGSALFVAALLTGSGAGATDADTATKADPAAPTTTLPAPAAPAAAPAVGAAKPAAPAVIPSNTKPAAKAPATEAPATKPADAKPADTKAADTKAADTKAADTKAPAVKPADAKPVAAKAAEPAKSQAEAKPAQPATPPADAKPAAKPADAKSTDAKPADAKPADAKPAAPASDAKPAPAVTAPAVKAPTAPGAAAPAPTAPATAPPAAASAAPSSTSAEAEAAWKAYEKRWSETADYSAGFRQTIEVPDVGSRIESAGRFYFAKPGLVRWEYTEGPPQTVVGDGTWLWLYQPDLQQVYKIPYAKAFGRGGLVELLAGREGVSERYRASLVKPDASTIRIHLKSVAEGGGDLEVTLAAETFDLKEVTVHDAAGSTTRMTFAEPRRNHGIDKARFRFTPPPAVDIISESAAF